jgi:hypothetical protein
MHEITVSGTANPLHYATKPPMGYEFIGTVTRNGTDTGALAVSTNDCWSHTFGQYCQCNGSSIRMLPQMPTFRAVLLATARHREEG